MEPRPGELRDGESFDEEPGPEWWFIECLCENKPDDPDGIDPCQGCQGWGEECGSVWKLQPMVSAEKIEEILKQALASDLDEPDGPLAVIKP